ncbi:fructosamine kinase family protein, partial [Rhodococcus sp. HNM0569]|nr:fructosamine kinase family protein [Rhodococcus sp. HNM0569]
MPDVVTEIDELTPWWLSDALGARVDTVLPTRVGTGQIGTCHRLVLTGDGVPTSVLAKLPAADRGTRAMLAGAYRAEVRFYAELARTVAVRAPHAYLAASRGDGADFVLLLEDVVDAEPGDQLAGCTAADAAGAIVNLAALHGPRWCDASLLDVDGLA